MRQQKKQAKVIELIKLYGKQEFIKPWMSCASCKKD